jgi:hypothetical protein
MNWEALGAIGELTGAMLLLGSLVYVGVQIRDTKRQMVASAAQARTDSFIELWKVRFEPGFIETETKSRNEPDSLTPEERSKLVNFLTMFMTFMQNNYYQRSVGSLEASQSGALDKLPLLMVTPLYVEIWQSARDSGSYSDEFVQHVDEVVRKGAT